MEIKTKFSVKYTSVFKKDYKKIQKQGKDIAKLKYVITELANGNELDPKYKNHLLLMINIIKIVVSVILNLIGY